MVSAAKPFAELKVIELAGSIAGAYCAKLFADNGAQDRRRRYFSLWFFWSIFGVDGYICNRLRALGAYLLDG